MIEKTFNNVPLMLAGRVQIKSVGQITAGKGAQVVSFS
jgi:hypothetical protein